MQLSATLVTVMSVLMSGCVVGNAFFQKKQFYPSVVHITKSNPSMAVLYVQAMVFVLLMGKLLKKIFFGQLRAAESEHLMERGWYAVTETCLAFTVFRDDFSPRFVAQFTLLLFLKCFHWLAEDRVDFMERSPLITLLFHSRMMGIVAVLSAVDSYFVSHAYFTTLLRGASVQIVFGFEYAILMTVVFHISIKYILHTVDLRNAHPWENKAVYLLYTELVISFVRCVLYTVFVGVMIKLHTFPLFSIRPFYLTVRSFKKAMHDVVMSRKAIHAMNNLFPDATAEELTEGDNVCIICREEMTAGAKKLPCNHIFHAACLRSWFQRQQTCPTCRSDILNMAPPPRRTTHPQQQQQQQNAPAQDHQQPRAQPVPPGGLPSFLPPPGFWPPPPPQGSQQQAQWVPPPFWGAGAAAQAWFPLPFPPAPTFGGLSDEEVRRMEGVEREGVEARVQCLRNIQTLLDAAAVQLQQYTSILSALAASQQFTSPPPQVVRSTAPEGQGPFSVPPPQGQEPSSPAKEPSPTISAQPEENYREDQQPTTSRNGENGAGSGAEMGPEVEPEVTTQGPEVDPQAEELRQRRLQRFANQ